MGSLNTHVAFYPRGQPSFVIAYTAFSVGELQDMWRKRLDPLGGEFAPGTIYRIWQVD
jgi:hypothetical protein